MNEQVPPADTLPQVEESVVKTPKLGVKLRDSGLPVLLYTVIGHGPAVAFAVFCGPKSIVLTPAC